MKTEGSGSPLQILNEPNLQNVSPNLLATQTGATSISITKQPMASQTNASSNVIIKPPIIKDLGVLHTSLPVTSSPATTPSLVVSVPLSTASGAAGLNLNPAATNATATSHSTAGQNLFQQAIQNRTEQLNFPNQTSSRHSTPISRASPVITVGNSAMQQQQQQQQLHLHHQIADHHHPSLQRQSPLVHQVSSASGNALVVIDNGNRASVSPTVSTHSQVLASGNLAMIQQTDSGMLKITYEKQQSAIVTPPNSNRLSAIQDEMAISGRRSR